MSSASHSLRMWSITSSTWSRFVSGLEQFTVTHLGVVAEMGVARGFHEPVRHERARRNDGLDDARFNQIAKNESHLADGESSGKRHDDETILVARHRLKNVRGVADLPAGERRISHCPDQFVDGAAFG